VLVQSTLALSSTEAVEVTEELAKLGITLYQFVFDDGEDDLRDLMARLDTFQLPDRPLRVRIDTYGAYVPWQLVMAPGQYDSARFWGMRYELAVSPAGSFSGPWPKPTDPVTVFAAYRGETSNDRVARLAALQAKGIQQRIAPSQFQIVQRNSEFATYFAQKAPTVRFIAAYVHASSGTVIVSNPGESTEPTVVPLVARDALGERISFAPNDVVRPIDLLTLRNRDATRRRPFFTARPFVFLNGCETGTAGTHPTTDLSFPGVLTRLGAGAVLVTEAPVWDLFALHFGNAIIADVLSGDEVSAAVLEARKKFLTESFNPLGLLYSFYGDFGFKLCSGNCPTQ
jgi:hypothetical protein